MNKIIKTGLSMLLCMMMLLTQFAFALDEAAVNGGGEVTDSAVAADTQKEEAASADEKEAEPAKEEAKPSEKAEETAKAEAKPSEKAEEAAKEEPKPAEKEKKESKPAFSGEAKLDGVIVAVKAAEGIFPEGAKLSVEKVSNENQKKVDSAVDAARDDDLNVASVYSFDVKVFDKNGKEVQPSDKKKVDISFKLDEADDANLDATIYHLEDTKSGLKAEELKTKTDKDVVSAETDGFSYYTVEFTYNDLQYVMDGDTSVALSDILKKVGLEGEVTDVKVSNADLFSTEKKDDKWMVTAHKAFTSREWMKVTIDGVVYEIVVTDTIPGNVVTGEVNMVNGDTKTGDFTITGGPVRGPGTGTGTIENGTVTNNASNSARGGVSGSAGSAFISRTGGTLLLDTEMINTSENKSIVINIWKGATATVKDSTLDGGNVEYGDLPFLLIGATDGAGTLNFQGTNTIQNTKSEIRALHNNSVLNVVDGTLTITASTIKNNSKFEVKSGATLKLSGNAEITNNNPTIKAGATLDLTDSDVYTLDNVGDSFNFEDGAILKLKEYDITEVLVSNNEKATISTEGGELVVTEEPALSGNETIEGKSVKVTADSISVQEGASITVKSGGELTFDKVTLEGRDNITIESGGKAYLKGTNTFNSCEISNSGTIYVEGEEATISGNSLAFNGNSGVINVEEGKILTANVEAITPTGKQQVQVYGTLILEETEVDLLQNGAIRWIRIEDGGTVNIKKSEFSGSTSLGVIRANAESTLNIDNSTFENNKANGSAEQVNGGVILAWNSKITIKESTFEGNSAASGGGAIWASNCTLDVSDSAFNNNNSHGHGGAIYQSGGTATVSGSTFDGNVAENGSYAHGGAICTLGRGEITIDGGSYFVRNKSHLGSAVIILGGATGYVNKAVFEENEITSHGGYPYDGGTLFVAESSTLYIPNVAIHDNSAPNGGAGLYVCGNGTAKVMPGAAAIYDNAGGDVMQRHYSGSHGSKTQIFDEALGGDQHTWTWTESDDGHNVLYATSDLASRPDDGGEKTKPMLLRAASGGDAKADVVLRNNKANSQGAGLGANGTVIIGDRTQIRIYKVWNDNSNASGKRLSDDDFVAQLTVKDKVGEKVDLSADGIEVTVHKSGEFDAFTEVVEAAKAERTDKVTASEDNWVIDITGLPEEGWPYIVYESASGSPGEAVSEYYLPPASTEPGTETKVGFTGFKNTYAEGKATIEGTKTLKGRDLKEGEFEFVLEKVVKDDKGEKTEEVGRAKCDADGKFAFEITYTLKDYLASLPSKEYTYYISEVKGEDKSIEYDTHKAEVKVNLSYTYGTTEITTEVIYEDEKLPEFVNEANFVEVTKVWDDNEDDACLRPDSVEVILLADGAETGDSIILSKDNNWKGKFENLPKYDGEEEIDYSVEEVAEGNIEYYLAEISGDAENGFTITNSLEVLSDVEATGVKNWVGDKKKDRPKSITIQLLENGTPLEDVILEVTPDASGDWTYCFSAMPRYRNGKEIEYSVKELNVPEGYIAESDGFNLTNTYKTTKPKAKGANTGDNNPALVLIAILAVCAAAIAGIIIKRRKQG